MSANSTSGNQRASTITAARWRMAAHIYATFAPYLKPYLLRLLLGYTSLLGGTLFSVLEPWPLKLIFDHLLWKKPLPHQALWLTSVFGTNPATLLLALCAASVLIVLLGAIASFTSRYVLSGVGQLVVNDIRLGIFDHLQSSSLASLSQRRTGDLVLRLTSDIKVLRDLLVGHLQQLGTHVLALLSIGAVMLWMDWRLTLLALTIVPVLYALGRYFSARLETAAKRKQTKESEVASILQEMLASIAVVQAFTQEGQERKRFTEKSRKSLKAALASARLGRAFSGLVKLLNACGAAVVVWYSVSQYFAGKLTPGDIVVFMAYIGSLYGPIQQLSDLAAEYVESLVAGQRLLELAEMDVGIKDAPHAVEARAFRGEVEFERVTFGYQPGEPFLDDLSFHVSPGQLVAIVGFSGTGKSTLIRLLYRFFDPWSGSVRIDGCDIRDFTLASLRQQISLVPQDPFLFRRTVRENIAYGCPLASDKEIVAAAQAAQAHEFILNLPNGYETGLSERGDNLSGGQRQRIALARALLRQTSMIVFDEPVTGLDAITESEFYRTFPSLVKGKTTFVISHRLATVRNAHVILVLHNGRVAARGTHEELLRNNELYRRLWQLQHQRWGPQNQWKRPWIREEPSG